MISTPMKSKFLLILYSLFLCLSLKVFAQPNNPVVKVWGTEEITMGGAPPPAFQQPLYRTTHRFYLETKRGYKIKVLAVWIGETAFSVLEQPYDVQFADQDDKPLDMALSNNVIVQVLATDTMRGPCFKDLPGTVKGNEAVIGYSMKGKKYYVPIKTMRRIHVNLP